MGYLDGFGVTISKWLGPGTDSGRRVTLQYPEQTRPKPERFHGRHVLNRYEDGMEKCIGCELCAGVCPARCIYVRGADNDPEDPTSPGERYGYVYEINYLRCIHCDLCVEACPTEAITETKLFEFAFSSRADAIYTKAELVVDDDGSPRQLPWENWDGGFDPAADTSGWMRATSPGGDEDFVGIVAWAGELGYGVRAPEGGGTVAADLAADVEVTSPTAGEPTAEPVAMAAGTEVAPGPEQLEELGEPGAGASAPLLVDADTTLAEPAIAPSSEGPAPEAVEPEAAGPGVAGPEAAGAAAPPGPGSEPEIPSSLLDPGRDRPRAGLFDAPDAGDASPLGTPSPRRGRGRRRDKGGSSRRDASSTRGSAVEDTSVEGAAVEDTSVEGAAVEDTSVEDAAVVDELDAALADLAPPAEPDAPGAEAAGSDTAGSDTAGSDTAHAVDPDEADDDPVEHGRPDEPPAPPTPPTPTAGFFDAPEAGDEDPEPKGRRGRRRRGGR